MKLNWEPEGKSVTLGRFGNWEVSTFKIDVNEIANKYGIQIIDGEQKSPKQAYPTSILYEFFDENDDLLPNQQNYAQLLPFKIGKDMRNKIHGCTVEDMLEYQNSGKEQIKKIAERFNTHNMGKYDLLDFYIEYEVKGSYAIMYFQYKIKQIAQ